MRFSHILAALAASVVFCQSADAQSLDPDPSVEAAFSAAEAGGWPAAYALLPANDSLARDLLTWIRLRDDPEETGANFYDYLEFLPRRRNWPGMSLLQAQGETTIPQGLPSQSIIDWFGALAHHRFHPHQ